MLGVLMPLNPIWGGQASALSMIVYGMLFVEKNALDQSSDILEANRDGLQEVYQDLHLVPHLEEAHRFFGRLALDMSIHAAERRTQRKDQRRHAYE